MSRFNQLFDILCSSRSRPVNKTLNEVHEYKCSETGITATKGVHSNKSRVGGEGGKYARIEFICPLP